MINLSMMQIIGKKITNIKIKRKLSTLLFLHCPRLCVPLQKGLALDYAKKSKLSFFFFCIVLAYAYLCTEMRITELLEEKKAEHHFSFEVLPPLKGNGTESLFNTINKLVEYHPLFINITTHHSEYVYKEREDGLLERKRVRRRPGTIAIAAAIQQRYGIPVVPHIICSGTTVENIEYELLDLQFLGINNLLLLRGDKAREDNRFIPTPGGHAHTTELIEQVVGFNRGLFSDGTSMKHPGEPFSFGVACYPEKHEEAPNLQQDMMWLKKKQEMGAEYAVTQLFYDNRHYYDFVARAREMGITIPIIPGIKPFAKLSQLNVVPKTFHCDIPQELASLASQCKTDEDARQLGIEWTTRQVRDLYAHGISNVHFYTVSAVDSVVEVVRRCIE